MNRTFFTHRYLKKTKHEINIKKVYTSSKQKLVKKNCIYFSLIIYLFMTEATIQFMLAK